jgi:hypothetical protein
MVFFALANAIVKLIEIRLLCKSRYNVIESKMIMEATKTLLTVKLMLTGWNNCHLPSNIRKKTLPNQKERIEIN